MNLLSNDRSSPPRVSLFIYTFIITIEGWPYKQFLITRDRELCLEWLGMGLKPNKVEAL